MYYVYIHLIVKPNSNDVLYKEGPIYFTLIFYFLYACAGDIFCVFAL